MLLTEFSCYRIGAFLKSKIKKKLSLSNDENTLFYNWNVNTRMKSIKL